MSLNSPISAAVYLNKFLLEPRLLKVDSTDGISLNGNSLLNKNSKTEELKKFSVEPRPKDGIIAC